MTPNVTATNVYLGSVNLKGHDIMFTNGAEDGWKHLSILSLPDDSPMKAIEIDCDDCSHCVELKTEQDDDPQELKDARQAIREWLNELLQ